jgi:hypothetical protein
MSLLDLLGQDRPMRRERGCVQPVLRDGRGIGQDSGGRRGEIEEDGSAEGGCIGYDRVVYMDHTSLGISAFDARLVSGADETQRACSSDQYTEA